MMTNLSLEHFENGVKLYQDNNLYKFTSDAIKLAKFCNIKHTDNVLDMCAGCGVVGLYAYSINKCNKIYFNEIQNSMCDLINKNIDINGLSDCAKVLNKDLNNLAPSDFDKPLDVIMCNPPYFKVNGKIKADESVAMCRHEITTNLSQIIAKAGQLIKNAGRFYLIIPADRLGECMVLLNRSGFETKNVEMFYSKDVVTVCVLESVKGGKAGLKIKIKKENL